MSSVFGTGFGTADAAGGATVTLGAAAAAGGAGGAGVTGDAADAGLAVVTGGLTPPVGPASGFAADAGGGLDALAAPDDGAGGEIEPDEAGAGAAVAWLGAAIGCGCIGAG